MQQKNRRYIAIISDTHGLVRPEAIDALKGADSVIHAGDIGKPEVLQALLTIAPVVAVRGNNDQGPWADALPETAVVASGPVRLYVLHDLKTLAVDPVAAGFAAVISGHSHRPCLERRQGVLFLNPGSAGPRRFRLPVSVARLYVHGATLQAELIALHV